MVDSSPDTKATADLPKPAAADTQELPSAPLNQPLAKTRASDPPAVSISITHVVTILLAVGIIAALSYLLPKNGKLALFLLDHSDTSSFPYPFTIQNVMHVLFALGLAEVIVRWHRVMIEGRFRRMGLLPEDGSSVLQYSELGPLRRRIVGLDADEASYLPHLIDLSIMQLITTRSVEQAVSIYTSALELMSHRLDLSYQTIRYLVWLIPTIGFIGTVVGISIALEGLNDPKHIDLGRITAGLAVAFYTTILALLESVVIVFFMNMVQRREELALNRAADYCLRNLINRYYAGS